MAKTLEERLSPIFPRFDESSNIRPFFTAFQAEFNGFSADTQTVEDSLDITEARGQSLDLIGDEFGVLGRRRDRDDEAYRQYLTSLSAAFGGRGRTEDVEFAVAAGLNRDPETDVELVEDFSNNEYQVKLLDFPAHSSGTVRELAEISDPVAIPRVDPVINVLDPSEITILTGETDIADMFVAEDAEITVETKETETVNKADSGLSSAALAPLSTSNATELSNDS